MKKIIITTLIITTYLISFSQGSLNEYRYFGIKTSIIHNISFPLKNNNNILIKSPYGDMLKHHRMFATYTPGGAFSVVYNFDFKNDKAGLVLGAEFKNFGYSNYFVSDTLDFKVNQQLRVYSVGIPIYLKFSTNNIYKNQLYGTFGFRYDFFFLAQSMNKASWNEQLFIKDIENNASKSSAFSITAGFNYNIYFIRLSLLTSNFIAKDFSTNIQEGTVRPYQHINITNNIYIATGVNIPLTRWLTARNWTAEKIRRFFKPTE